jgi:hypothetical protein
MKTIDERLADLEAQVVGLEEVLRDICEMVKGLSLQAGDDPNKWQEPDAIVDAVSEFGAPGVCEDIRVALNPPQIPSGHCMGREEDELVLVDDVYLDMAAHPPSHVSPYGAWQAPLLRRVAVSGGPFAWAGVWELEVGRGCAEPAAQWFDFLEGTLPSASVFVYFGVPPTHWPTGPVAAWELGNGYGPEEPGVIAWQGEF